MPTPLSLLLDLDRGDYWDLMDEIVVAMRTAGAMARLKGGILLEVNGARQHVETTEFTPGQGRRIRTSSRSRDLANTRSRFAAVLESSEKLYVSPDFDESSLLRNRPECISISDAPEGVAQELTDIARVSGMLMVSMRWREDDALAGDHLWRSLLLTRIVSGDSILMDYEEFPLDELFDEDLLRWRATRDPWPPADGFFFSDDSDVYPEVTSEHVEIPPDLAPPAAPSPLRSPLERVLNRVGAGSVLRISAQDDPHAPAHYDLPYAHVQYPDVALVERKVRDYCLNPAHPQRKWEGFAAHGWDARHPTHSIQLAALLSSALLLPFTPLEARVTADGAIQFGALIALPSFRSVYAPVMTAWVAQPNNGIQLATAYIAAPDTGSLDPTFAFSPLSSTPWNELVDEAVEFGDEAPDDLVAARARLFVSRQGRGNALARWLVQSGGSHGDFRRAAIGGRCVLAPIGSRRGWVQAGRATAYAQVKLGLEGIRSLPATWVD